MEVTSCWKRKCTKKKISGQQKNKGQLNCDGVNDGKKWGYTPKNKHGTWKWWLPIGISFSKGPFSGSMFVLGGVAEQKLSKEIGPYHLMNPWFHLILLYDTLRVSSWGNIIYLIPFFQFMIHISKQKLIVCPFFWKKKKCFFDFPKIPGDLVGRFSTRHRVPGRCAFGGFCRPPNSDFLDKP